MSMMIQLTFLLYLAYLIKEDPYSCVKRFKDELYLKDEVTNMKQEQLEILCRKLEEYEKKNSNLENKLNEKVSVRYVFDLEKQLAESKTRIVDLEEKAS